MRSRFLFSCYYLQSSLDDTVSVYVGIFLSSLSIWHSCSCYMESIEWTHTTRGAKALVILYIDDTLILLVVLIRGKEKKFIGSSNSVNER